MIFSIPYNPSVSISLTHNKLVNLHFHLNFLYLHLDFYEDDHINIMAPFSLMYIYYLMHEHT